MHVEEDIRIEEKFYTGLSRVKIKGAWGSLENWKGADTLT